MIKGTVKKLIIVTISSLIPLIIFELFLSIDDHRPDYERFIYKINNVSYRFNDNPLDYLNDKNKEKIIFLGDSYTEGEVCASKKKDFVNIIKTQNEINYKKSIYNFASEGRGSVDYLNIYYYLKQKNLSKVIVVVTYNDILMDRAHCRTFNKLSKDGYPKIKICDTDLETKIGRKSESIITKIDNFLEKKTRTWIFIRNRLANISFLQKYYGRSVWANLLQNPQSEEFIIFLNTLKKLQADAKENGIIIDFVYFPDVYNLKKDFVPYKASKFFMNVAMAEDIIIYDPWEYFLEHKDSNDMSWSLIDFHPNCKAHEIMANYINEKILKNKLQE